MPQHKSDKANIKPQKKIPRKISETYLHNSGLYYLERFAASKKHFKFVMKNKVRRSCIHHTEQDYDQCAAWVDALADKFEKVGLIDDNVFTRGLVTSLRRKGKSRAAILNKLNVKGISQENTIIALELLDAEHGEDAEKNAALKLARKKRLGAYFIPRREGDEQDMKKSLGVFARAGFSYQIAKEILDMDIDDGDEAIWHL